MTKNEILAKMNIHHADQAQRAQMVVVPREHRPFVLVGKEEESGAFATALVVSLAGNGAPYIIPIDAGWVDSTETIAATVDRFADKADEMEDGNMNAALLAIGENKGRRAAVAVVSYFDKDGKLTATFYTVGSSDGQLVSIYEGTEPFTAWNACHKFLFDS